MKVSIGSKIVEGPWGGGNLFAINLSNYLLERGHSVLYDLTEPDIDLILLTDPRSRSESSSTFNHIEIEKYKQFVNPNVSVVQRINECDERKNTSNINNFYLKASLVVDHVVFVSSWLRNIYTEIGMDKEKTSVILAGANKEIFNLSEVNTWNKEDKIKLVTHHWSNHYNKGFDIYELINNMLLETKWKNKLEFTYIGNLNENYNLENTKLIKPLHGIKLAEELKKNHIYITGSINEPSGNHHIEAAQCGLPILYRDSGGIPEYCDGYGLSFDDNFETILEKMIIEYSFYLEKMKNYPFNSDKMCKEFLDLFEELIENKSKISFTISTSGSLLMKKNKLMNKFRISLLSTSKRIVSGMLNWIKDA